MNSEFRDSDVLDIVTEALEDVPEVVVETPQGHIPLAFNEGKLLEVLADILPKYMQRADMQVVFDELREHLYSGIGGTNLRTLHSMSKNCKRCPMLTTVADLPTWNFNDPDMVIVAESSALTQDSTNLLAENLAKVGFSSRNLCLTYVNRCKAQGRKHSADEIENCLPYLHTELQLLKPKLILTMGAVASSAVTSAKIDLGEDRGNILWMGPWPILPTWAPGYVLKGQGRLADQFEQDMRTAFNFTYGRSE